MYTSHVSGRVALLNLGDAGVPLKIFQQVECCCDLKLDMLNLERRLSNQSPGHMIQTSVSAQHPLQD